MNTPDYDDFNEEDLDSYLLDGEPDPFPLGEVDDSPRPPTVATSPTGDGWLILDGPGAGTTVLPADSEEPDASRMGPLATRDMAVGGERPTLIVHCPYRQRQSIPRLLASVAAQTNGAVALAATVELPAGATNAHAEWLNSCRAAAVRIADPACYLLDHGLLKVKAINKYAPKRTPYLLRSALDMSEILDAQRAVGANLLLSPGRAPDPADAENSLDTLFEQADDALAELASDERLALNLTISSQWLSNPRLRDVLLAHLLDQDQFKVWYVRVQWPASLPTLHQPVDLELLTGYKRLSQLAGDEERVLFLPQTGLTGWLQLAFGASGFGAGLPGTGHAFREDLRRSGNGAEPIPRYFETSLLHSVERSAHDVIAADSGYLTCDCPYCPALLKRPSWDHVLSQLHHLHSVGRLAGIAELSGRSIESSVRRAVRAAAKKAAGARLVDKSIPKHLQVWDRIL